MLNRRLHRLWVPINLVFYVLSAPKFFCLHKSSAAERLLILNQATRHWGSGTATARESKRLTDETAAQPLARGTVGTLPAFGSRSASAD
jgi:hypothetical protein